jgi:hypothetical protein
MFKKVKIVLLVLLLGAALFAGYRLRQIVSGGGDGEIVTPSRTISIHTTVRQVFPVAEFVSLNYRYASVMKDVSSKEMFGFTIPGTEKKLLAIIDGTIKLGIHCNEIQIDTARSDTLFIKFPPIKIISHEVHPETAEVYDQKDGIFNKYRASDQFSLEAKQKAETELDVRANRDIILQARAATEYAFKSFLHAIPALDTIPIVFRWN